jgi:hypothetical protein
MKRRLSKMTGGHARSRRASIADLEPEFESMIDKAMRAIIAYEPNPDRVFGKYSELVSVTRSVAFHEGKLLEWGIAAIARRNPDLVILPPDRPMPIVPAAIELFRKNEWREIQGIRLPSEVHANKTYTPDLFIANRARHSGLIIDVKRSLGSYTESKLESLRFRMLAVAAIASSWLAERQGPVLVEVGTAIIDGADIASDHERGVFKISEVGDLLEIDEAGDAMTRLRDMFAERVQNEFDSQCRKVIGTTNPFATELVPNVDFSDGDTKETPPDAERTAVPAPRRDRNRSCMPSLSTNVRVGFARFRSGS